MMVINSFKLKLTFIGVDFEFYNQSKKRSNKMFENCEPGPSSSELNGNNSETNYKILINSEFNRESNGSINGKFNNFFINRYFRYN